MSEQSVCKYCIERGVRWCAEPSTDIYDNAKLHKQYRKYDVDVLYYQQHGYCMPVIALIASIIMPILIEVLL